LFCFVLFGLVEFVVLGSGKCCCTETSLPLFAFVREVVCPFDCYVWSGSVWFGLVWFGVTCF